MSVGFAPVARNFKELSYFLIQMEQGQILVNFTLSSTTIRELETLKYTVASKEGKHVISWNKIEPIK